MKAENVLVATRAWLDGDVIGLNLCPFARAVRDAGQIRFVVSEAETARTLRIELVAELRLLGTLDPAVTDTTLLIHPRVLADFLDYNDFLGTANGAVDELGLSGTFQIASFHPRYQFAGEAMDDPANRSNRSPYPMLQLLREASVRRALKGYPGDPADIPRRNIERLRREAK
ncbi:MAG TPA: DUF1415 domain-containing protein [Planctomycetota bacterium]